MKLRNRLLLVALGIVLFLLITPFIVLYARGFKYDFSTNQIVKTGTLVVRTEPAKADVYLNDEESSGKTPLNIRFLLPRDYNVRIEKDGYQSWTKRLTIRQQFVTWVNEGREFIALFLKQPQLSLETAVDYASVSKNRTKLAYISNNELHEINADSQHDNILEKISTPLNLTLPLVWSGAEQLGNVPTDISGMTKIESNDSYTAAIIKGDLYLLTNDGLDTVLDEGVLEFSLDRDSVWYVRGNEIRRLNLITKAVASVSALPDFQKTQLVRSSNQLFIILDQTLYLVNDSLEKIYSPTTFAFPDSHSGYIIYGNNNEVLTYNPDSHRSELILRSITPISSATMNWETGYLLFVNDDKIKAVELDSRDHRNVYTLLELNDNFLDFVASDDGIWIYVVNKDSIIKYRIR